ncbi:MAG: DinB family protein, partial [Planctomycetales bacterium]
MGSHPTTDVSAYPPVEEVLAHMRERRETLLKILDGLSEAELEQATPEGAPDFLGTFEAVFRMAGWHEGMHAGQLTIARRSLGHSPFV